MAAAGGAAWRRRRLRASLSTARTPSPTLQATLHPPGYYASLLLKTPDAAAASALAKDVDRTFPGHDFFDSEAGLATLTRVLSAFAVHNPEIGYCQSLNFLAGFLLVVLPEEQAFWTLEVLVGEILPPHYFNAGLLAMFADQRVLAHLVDELYPDLGKIIAGAGIELHTVTVEMIMCLFCTTLPTHSALRVWDAVFAVGFEAVFRVALALFHANLPRILSVAASASATSVAVAVSAGAAAEPAAASAEAFPQPPAAAGASASAGTPAAAAAFTVSVSRVGAPAPGASPAHSAADNSSGIATRSTAVGVGQDSLELEKAINAAVAATLLLNSDAAAASAAAAGRAGDGAASPLATADAAQRTPASWTRGDSGGAGDASPTPPPALSTPTFRGGTVRQGAALFPAVYNMLKTLPNTSAAFDIDGLMAIAYPQSAKEAKAAGLTANWDVAVSASRIQKLRCVAAYGCRPDRARRPPHARRHRSRLHPPPSQRRCQGAAAGRVQA